MKLTIVCMGKTRERFVQDGLEKYARYLRHYVELDLKVLKEEKIRDLRDAPAIRRKEAETIYKALPHGASLIIALDERGEELTSHEFAAFLNHAQEAGSRELVFILGGALGLDEAIREKAQKTVAMSRWTFTHEIARLILLEQLYRAFTIITGKTYHY